MSQEDLCKKIWGFSGQFYISKGLIPFWKGVGYLAWKWIRISLESQMVSWWVLIQKQNHTSWCLKLHATMSQFFGTRRTHSRGEQRNYSLKYESDCVRIGIGIKRFMNRGRFCKRSFCWVFVIHTAIKWKHSFCSRTSFHSRCVSYKNCKLTRRT